jgi:hypothetical protein
MGLQILETNSLRNYEISLPIDFTKSFDKVCDSLLVETRQEIEVKFKKNPFCDGKNKAAHKNIFFRNIAKNKKAEKAKNKKN